VSTVVVVKKNGVVAIAADTLTTCGTRKLSAVHNQQPGKIVRLGDTFLGLTGWAVSQQVLSHAYRDFREVPAMSTTSEIFDMFMALHVRLKDDYFLNPGYFGSDPYESSHISVLIANSHGIFGVSAMRDVMEYQRFWASGSGSPYALGAMHALYDSAGAQAIAEAGVAAGIEFDDGSGAPIESHVIPVVPTVQELELLLKM
jgi:ATP-dependent HslUV protease subunit HslV